jgi:hypothetical protein
MVLQYKYIVFSLFAISSYNKVFSQSDSIQTINPEISFGFPLFPAFYNTLGGGNEYNPSLVTKILDWDEYSPSFSINYKKKRKEKKNNRLGIVFSKMRDNGFYGIFNLGQEHLIGKCSNRRLNFLLGYDLSLGYLEFNDYTVSGGKTNYWHYKAGRIVTLGTDASIIMHYSFSKKWFIESEVCLFVYYGISRWVVTDYFSYSPYIDRSEHVGIVFSKLAGINIGYKF